MAAVSRAAAHSPQRLGDRSWSCFVEANEDTVRFEAGGLDEMCWHLITWGKSVTVEKPARLRRRLATMCGALAGHHSVA